MPHLVPPDLILTPRLRLRRWLPDDAPLLLPVLAANVEHLHWIPARVAGVVPLEELRIRMAGFAEDFDAGRSWRFGIFEAQQGAVLGEASLFPRSATGRVDIRQADRIEIGYWLRADATGLGYATEAAEALATLAGTIPGMVQVEIRCDPQNAPSAAVPRRLGFQLAESSMATDECMRWVRHLPGGGG